MITEEDLLAYQTIYKNVYGVEIDSAQAQEQATKLLLLISVIQDNLEPAYINLFI